MVFIEFGNITNETIAYIWNLTRLMPYYNDTMMEDKGHSMISLINLYCILPIVLLGTIGNLLSIAVFRCTNLRRVSASYYLTMVLISDTGYLLTLFAKWLDLVVAIPVSTQPILCQFFLYLSYVCGFLSPWLIVIFTVERFVATCYPLWRAVICTVARAKAIVVLLVCLASLSYIYLLFIIGLEPDDNSGDYCIIKPGYHDAMTVLNTLDTVFTMVVPVILIIVLNIKIARAIWHFEHVRRHMTMVSVSRDECNSSSTDVSAAVQLNNTSGVGTPASVKYGLPSNCCTHYQVKITKMLLIISSVFIGLNAPSYVVRLMVYFMSEKEAATYTNLQMWCQLGYNLNFAINFLLYCVSGQNFRKSLKSLLWKAAHKTKHRQLSRSNTGTTIANCNNSTVTNNAMPIGLISACQPCQMKLKSVSGQEKGQHARDTV